MINMWCKYIKRVKKVQLLIYKLPNPTILLCSISCASCLIIQMIDRLLFQKFSCYFDVVFSLWFYFLPAHALPLARKVIFFCINRYMQRSKISDQSQESCKTWGISIPKTILLEQNRFISKAVEIPGFYQRMLTKNKIPAKEQDAGNPTNSSKLPVIISVIPVSQIESVYLLQKFQMTVNLFLHYKNKIYSILCTGFVTKLLHRQNEKFYFLQ